jgi:hypothetical protein
MMTRRPPARVLWGKLAWHPAVKAWRALAHDARDPERIEVLWRTNESATYRLVGAGPGGAAIIARRSRIAQAWIERRVCEWILPLLPKRVPRYCGFKAESQQFAWLFLADRTDG